MNERERFQRLKRIFDEACELPAHDRAAYLDSACGGDVELREEVAALLAAEGDPDAALGVSHRGAGPEILAEELSSTAFDAEALPARIGDHEILREIGRGGMGVVYEAQQAHPRRRVALKVIRGTYVTPELVKRFRHEAQLLGQLDHSGIAHVYEAGSAMVGDTRRPYLVMELVDGQPLDEHVRAERVDVRQILELMAMVCDAVQHAHQRGIIHRDLKPPNVLVKRNPDLRGDDPSVIDAPVQPKVLDFGVARATDADLAVTTVNTRAGQVVGTLSYMSPEQVAGQTDVDTRCDVYALGVILYELLAGERPFDLARTPMAEAARVIAEEDPTSLGTRVPDLDHDVVTIVSKAMDKDRERRYRSAAELADDLRRYLRSEPISARPPSATYLLRRFARRNRAIVVGTLATITVLVAGLIASTAGFISARTERDAKTSALETSDAVIDFLSDMLTAARPEARGRDVTVVDLLGQASGDLGDRFENRPGVAGKLRSVIGGTYVALGEYQAADSHAVAAVELLRVSSPGPDPELADALVVLGTVKYFLGDPEAALAAATEAAEMFGALDPPDEERALNAEADAAFMTMALGRLDEARERFVKVSSAARRLGGPDGEASMTIDGNLAMLDGRRRDYAASEERFLDVIERSRRVRGADHPSTTQLVANYASVLVNEGRPAEAIPYLRETLAAQEKALGEGHSKTLITLGNLAQALTSTGSFEEAEALAREDLRRAIQAYGDRSRSVFFARHSLAWIVGQSGDTERSIPIFAENLALSRDLLTFDDNGARSAWTALIGALLEAGAYAACLDTTRSFIGLAARNGVTDGRHLMLAHRTAAQALVALKRYDDAERELDLALAGADSTDRHELAEAFVELYEATGREDAAREWRRHLDP